jgi:hypothetical protein
MSSMSIQPPTFSASNNKHSFLREKTAGTWSWLLTITSADRNTHNFILTHPHPLRAWCLISYSPFAETRESSITNARDISFALRMKSCSDHVMCVPLQGCPKSECILTCVRMQWVHWTNCALCPLLAVSCGDAGLALFTLSRLREWTLEIFTFIKYLKIHTTKLDIERVRDPETSLSYLSDLASWISETS